MKSLSEVVSVAGVLLVCSACGGGGDGDGKKDVGGGTISGTVTNEWRSLCTGVFTKDYQVTDWSGQKQFTARAGEEYLLSRYNAIGPEAFMIFLWPDGPEEFEVKAATLTDFPFKTSCPPNTAALYYAVFEDVSVFAELALTTKLCDLKAGTALPRTSALTGHDSKTSTTSGPSTYEVFLNVFSAQCGGAASGYVSVPQVRSFTANTWLVPILGVLAPR